MKKRWITALTLVLVFALAAGCQAVDVVLSDSPKAFDKILRAYPELLTGEEDGYYLLSVDGATELRFSKDYTATGGEDILIVTPLAPFTDAGLDLGKLDAGYRADEANLYVSGDYGDAPAQSQPAAALLQSAQNDRKALSYHGELDHYGIGLAHGKFEYAKEHEKNDKDIVFVLLADPLEQRGVDVEKVEGWVYMEMDDMSGGALRVLLKPYTL